MDFYYEKLELNRWFRRENIVCTDGQFSRKTGAGYLLCGGENPHMNPENCIVIEDAVAGAYAARGAGIGYIVIIDPEDSGLIWVGEQVDL